jgi:hypothetical protein
MSRVRAAAAAVLAAVIMLVGPAVRPDGPPAAWASDRTDVRDPVPLYEMVVPGGIGRFYTISAREAGSAAAGYGVVRQRGYIAYLGTAPFDGAQPIYRLRYLRGPGYLYSRSTVERDALTASGNFTYEGVLGYGFESAGPGRVQLNRFSRNGEWRIARSTAAADLAAQGYRDDGILTWAAPEAVRAGAIYFGTWNRESTMVIAATQHWFKRPGDWWGGVRDYSGRDPSVGPHVDPYKARWGDVDFSHLEPSIGYYDDADPATLEKHITQATGAGLRFFSFYWYWNAERGTHVEDGLDTFLRAGNRAAMDFSIALCAHPGAELRIGVASFDRVAQSIVDRYLNQPNYLRDNEGRPILQLCDHRGIGDAAPDSAQQLAQARDFVGRVREAARQRLGEELLVLGSDQLMLSSGGRQNPLVTAIGADGTSCTVDPTRPNTYHGYVDGLPAYLNSAPPVFGRCVAANFDERPRYPHLIQDQAAVRFYPDHTVDLFGQAAGRVRTSIAESTRMSSVDNFVFVYAWNEWHEGGIVEPNKRDGCHYLDVLQAELHLAGPGCVPSP